MLDRNSISKAIKDIEKIVKDGRENAEIKYDFKSFKAKNEPYCFAVIDGSNHNKKGSNFIFTTLRAGYQIYRTEKLIEQNIDKIKVELIANNEDVQVGFMNKFERYFQEIVGDLPKKYPEFEKTPERIRSLLEWVKLVELIDKLGDGDIIMFDGSLISGTITTNQNFFNKLTEKAQDKGITLVGLSKDTSLSIDSAPIPMILNESSRKHYPNKNWYVEHTPGTYFVRFTKLKEIVYRLDVVKPEHFTIEEVASKIADYCYEDAILAYPYPMQTIHDAVRIDQFQKEECFSEFKREYLSKGLPERKFEEMFSIYHDQLDKISFGR